MHNMELFYLRKILKKRRGAMNWTDLLAHEGVTFASFEAAARAQGMMEDDTEYFVSVAEMVQQQCSLDGLRADFTCMLVNCKPKDPAALFARYASELCGVDEPSQEDIQCTLWTMEAYANSMGASLGDSFDLPTPPMPVRQPQSDEAMMALRAATFARMSDEQVAAAEAIMNATMTGQGGIFMIQASGGTGKSFWANGVAAALKLEGFNVACVAASALAAGLLLMGQTAHAAFKLPLNPDENSHCGGDVWDKERMSSLDCIFYDESSMVHQLLADCLERSLRDVTGSNSWFGGKVSRITAATS
jgi:ATP-dependent DNA helicase PIF1